MWVGSDLLFRANISFCQRVPLSSLFRVNFFLNLALIFYIRLSDSIYAKVLFKKIMFNPISGNYLYYIQLKQYKLHVKCCSDFAFIAGTYSQELIKQGIRKEKEGKVPNTSWDLIREMNRLNSLIGEAQWGS